jgi:hypothetical protein
MAVPKYRIQLEIAVTCLYNQTLAFHIVTAFVTACYDMT